MIPSAADWCPLRLRAAALFVMTMHGCGNSAEVAPDAGYDARHIDGSTINVLVPYAEPVVVDGQLGTEWDDADTGSVVYAGGPVALSYKHDGDNLLFAFAGLNRGGRFGFAEVLIDGAGDRSCSWSADDWWFHASGTDCAAPGARDQWGLCVPQADDWQANNAVANEPADLVEISIPFRKMSITGQFGLALRVTDTATHSVVWPDGADPDRPCTWTIALLENVE